MASASEPASDGKGRLLLVSNRLPITIKRSDDATYDFSMSSGGLVSGLSGLAKTTKFQWYGWPGIQVPQNEISLVKDRLWKEYGAITFDESAWDAYREANRLFAKEIAKDVQDNDLIWVHDYHLMLLPAMLREEIGDSKRNFQGKVVTVGAFPIGIDPEKFEEGLKKPKVAERIQTLEKKFQGVKLIVGVDRLDYIKGVPQKLHALEVFLTEHPEWIGKVVLVQVAVPSRQDVEEYQNLRAVVNELVGRINGKFGTIEFMPIHFMHKSVSFDELIALYAVSDVCLVSSTRDGMNLVSYEYIATQQKRHGSMILSEFTGAAQSLNGSIIVNPWNTEELADAIHDAVTMGDEQRSINYQKLAKYVNKYTRISEQAEKKIKVKQSQFGKVVEETTHNNTSAEDETPGSGVNSGVNSGTSTPKRPDAKRATTTI
ncbi:unnamed protein product [Aureobasidium pullulans]|nr:unnamed protein product [Aureobasidium pullulans]